MKDLEKAVLESEERFVLMFSNPIQIIRDGIIRYEDSLLPDMYDHNFTCAEGLITQEDLAVLETLRTERKEAHLKIESPQKQDILIENGFEEEVIHSMIKVGKEFCFPTNIDISFTSFKKRPELMKQVVELEVLYYGPSYGEDFCRRRWKRYADKAADDPRLDIVFAVNEQEEVAGYCYIFDDGAVTALDALFVVPSLRHRYVASTLLKHVRQACLHPLYLHASEEETSKDMYSKLGFSYVSKRYEYLKLFPEDKR